MSVPQAMITAAGDARVFAGEPLAIELQITDANSASVNLLGRNFALLAFQRSDRTVIESVIARADSATVSLVLDGDQTEALFTASRSAGLGYEIVELIDGGVNVLVGGLLTVQSRGGAFTGTPSNPIGGAPVTQLTFSDVSPLVVISQRGAPGLSAFQQLYEAGTITAPTIDAFTAWLMQLISSTLRAAAPALDFSDPDNSQNLG